MAITPGAVGALAASASASVTPAHPSGLATGDVLLAEMYSRSGNTPTPPPGQGWTQVQIGTNSARLSVWLRTFTAGDTAGAWTGGGTTGFYGVISAFRGVDPTTPLDVAVPAAATGAATTATAPSVTTATATAMVVSFFANADNGAGTGFTGPTNGFTLAYGGSGYVSGTGSDGALAQTRKSIAAPGATGANSLTVDDDGGFGTSAWVAITVALRDNSGVVVTASDAADATEAAAVAGSFAATDTGTPVTESATSAAAVDAVDAAAASEVWVITQQRTVVESGTGTDLAAVTAISYVSGTDSGAGADTAHVDIPELFAAADAATSADVATTTALALATDQAAGSDVAAASGATTANDAGAGAESVAVLRISAVADVAAGTDATAPLAALLAALDVASGADAQSVLRCSAITDSGTGIETAAAGPRVLDSGELTETVEIVVIQDVQRTGEIARRRARYELLLVARAPQASGPPTLFTIDAIAWRTLGWGDTLSQPQSLEAVCPRSALTETVKQRLRTADRAPVELHLQRDGQVVAAGPLRRGRRSGEDLTLTAVGLLGHLQGMWVRSDTAGGSWPAGGRFDQVDQFAIAAALIDQWQSADPANGWVGGHFGIDTSQVGTSGVLRDREYARTEQHKVSTRLEELGAVEGGFDAAVDPVTRQLVLSYPQRGVDRSTGPQAVVFDKEVISTPDVEFLLGPDEVASVAFGSSSSTWSDTVLWSQQINAELLAQYGAVGVAASHTGISEQATLDARVSAALSARDHALWVPGGQMRVTPDVDLTSYGVGDVVQVVVDGDLGAEGPWRIRRRQVQVSEQGVESVDLQFA